MSAPLPERPADRLVAALVALGVLLRVARWLDGRSLHADEAALALNLLDRDWRGLLGPLRLEQVAPVGFLWLEKLATLGFGEGALAFRLPSLLAGVGALLLFARLCRSVLPAWPARLAVALFAVSEPLVFYSSEVKPYAFDVLAAVAVAWAGLDEGRGRGALLAVVGALAAAVSFAAVFCCAAAAALLCFDLRRGRRGGIEVGLTLGVWAAAFGATARWAAAGAPRALLVSFWDFGFPARPWWTDPGWLPRSVFGAFRDPAGLEFVGLAGALAAAGVVASLARNRSAALWLGLAPLLALLAALLRLYPFPTSLPGSYPFHGRLVLFVAPALLVFVAAGAGFLAESLAPARRPLAVAAVAVLLWPPLATAAAGLVRPPRFQDVAPLVDLIGRRARPGDYVFVSEWAASGFEFHLRGRLATAPVLASLRVRRLRVHGTRADYAQALAEPAPGERVWTVFTHHRDWHSEADEALAVELLLARGARLLRRLAAGASAELFSIGPPAPAR